MRKFELRALIAEQAGEKWREFLRVPALSMGVYRLKPGDLDQQSPHGEDEVYYVISGRARFSCGDQDLEVGPGTILFVERLVDHRFIDIREELTVLVFFAPAEGSLKKAL